MERNIKGGIFNTYDFGCMAECGQPFEGLMPKAIDELGGIGASDVTIRNNEDGNGVDALEVIDIEGLASK